MTVRLTGQVSGFQQRYEPTRAGSVTVWDFRIDRHDGDGKPLPRVAAEMRGMRIEGGLSIGDWVETDSKWRPGKTLQLRNIKNLSTNSVVEAHGAGKPGRVFGRIGKTIFILVWLAIASTVVLTIAGHH